MKVRLKWKFIVPLMVMIGLVGCGFSVYWQYEPSRHFDEKEIPVLVMPNVSPSQENDSLLEKKAVEPSNPMPTSDVIEPIGDPTFNVLILGMDAREDELSRSDVIFVAHVNPIKKQVNLISIPRDTRVNIPGIGYTKVNHSHILGEGTGGNHGGTQSVMQVISDFLNIKINYYVKTNFEGFERFINTIDGIDVELEDEVSLTYTDHKTIGPGRVHLNGETALMFVRERKSLTDGDFGRQKNQALILKALAKKLLQVNYMKQMPSLIEQVKEDVLDTNFTDGDLISLAWMMSDMNSDQMEYRSIPGHSERLMDPLVRMELYYWIPDLVEVKSIAESFFSD